MDGGEPANAGAQDGTTAFGRVAINATDPAPALLAVSTSTATTTTGITPHLTGYNCVKDEFSAVWL